MSTALPLPRGFFDASTRLTEDARRRYVSLAEAAVRQTFALGDTSSGSREKRGNAWIPVREKHAVAVYRNFSHARAAGSSTHRSNVAEVSGKASMHATLDEIARAYAAHDDALFRRLMKKLNSGVMDAAVLATIVPRTPHTPFRYIGIKWFAVKSPTLLVSHRDYCCLEVQDKIVDGYGNEMYIRLLSSIEVPECPSLENSHALVRAKLLAGFMYRVDRAEPSLVRVHHVMRFDPCGYFPSQWAYKTAESQLISSVVQIRRIIEKQQMNACTFVDKKQWVPNHERQSCVVCSRAFGTFRPRHHCRCCGEVICGKCSVFRSVDVPGTTIKNVRICSICNMGVQKSAAGARDVDTTSDVSSSSVTSSSTVAHNEMNMMDLYLSANNPGTPSAYSSASSTNSNLSFRSTASSRSVLDARSRGFSSQPNAGLFRTGSQRGGFFGSRNSQTPRSYYESNTPRSYIANNLTPRDTLGFGGSSGSITPSSDNGRHTPSSAAQRMSIFKQNPLDLGYLRDSISSHGGGPRQSIATSADSSASVKVAPSDVSVPDMDVSELSVASTTSPLSSSNSAQFIEEKEAAPRTHLHEAPRSRAMTHQPRVVPEGSERASSSVSVRKSASSMRFSAKDDGSSRSSSSSSTKKAFFSGLFTRSSSTLSNVERTTQSSS